MASPRAAHGSQESPAPPAVSHNPRRAHSRQLRNGVISLTLLIAVVAGLLSAVPALSGVTRALGHLDRDTVGAALGLELLSCVGYVLAFQLVFARAPRRFAARLAWTEMAFGAALSFGGAGSLAIGAWVLKSRGVPAGRIAERSATFFLLTSAVNVIVLIVFGLGLGLGVLPGRSDPLLTLGPAAAGVAVLVFFLSIPRLAAWAGPDRKASRRLTRVLLGLAESIRETRRTLITPDWRLLGPYAYLLFDVSVLYVCLDAVGHAPPLAPVVLAYQIGYLANILPVPGGIGVLDAGLVGMLALFGVPATTAAAGVLLYHAAALWVPTVFGTIAFLLVRRTLSEPLLPRPTGPR